MYQLTRLIQIRYLQLRVHRGNPQHEHRGRSRDTPPAPPPPHFVFVSRTPGTTHPRNQHPDRPGAAPRARSPPFQRLPSLTAVVNRH